MPEQVIAIFSVQSGYGVPAWSVMIAAMGAVVLFQLMGWTVWRAIWQDAGRGRGLPLLLVLFFQQVLGMGSAMLLLLGLALVGAFHVPGLLVAGVLVVLAVWWVQRWRPHQALVQDAAPGGTAGAVIALWEWGVLLLGAIFISMVAWRFPGHWDDTAYHLPLARTIVEHHGLVANEWLRFPYFPAYAQLLFAAGLLLDPSLAQWLASWPVVVTLLGLMGAGRWFLGHAAWGVLAWLVYVYTPLVKTILGFAYLDMLLALYATAAGLAAAVWVHADGRKDHRWLLLAGLCAGIASGIKLQGLVVAAAVGMGVLVFSGAPRQAVRNLVWYGFTCLAVCVFWYGRSYWVTGDPIHPAGGSVFGYYLWTPQDLQAQVAEQAVHGVPKRWANFLDGLLKVEAIFLCAALVIPVFAWGRRRPWLLIWLVVVLLVLFWFWVSQVSRYLMPVLPLGALLALAPVRYLLVWGAAKRPPVRGAGALLAVAASALMLVHVGITGSKQWQQPTVQAQRAGRSDVILLERAQALQAQHGHRVLNFGFENAFFFYSGQLVGDWFGPASFSQAIVCDDSCRIRSTQVLNLMNRFGIRMVLIHAERFPFDKGEFSEHLDLIATHGSGYLYALKESARPPF
ncbi:hypothetical protein [Diaphorobacter sp. LR2014-1]|uniref:hypothetical protein n=1 Tax=Diaphorobacter sp. LR2014-1 TaxID=1933219 RepID=UPI0011AF8E0A|nr:hypothetical protein [Diaphorobacter sp. LR2014-1]